MLHHMLGKMPDCFTNVTGITACTRKLVRQTWTEPTQDRVFHTKHVTVLILQEEKTSLIHVSKSLQQHLIINQTKSNSYKNTWTIELYQMLDFQTLDFHKNQSLSRLITVFLRPLTWPLFKHIYSPNTSKCNQLDCVWLSLVAELSQNSVKHNLMDCVQFIQLSSIGLEFKLTQSLVFSLVQLPNSIELNRTWVWLGLTEFRNIWLTMPNYKGCCFTVGRFCTLPCQHGKRKEEKLLTVILKRKTLHLHGLSFICTLKFRKTNRSIKSSEKDQ